MTNEHERQNLRILYYLPIIHTQADMGQLNESIKQATIRKMGVSGWRDKVTAIEKFWKEIDRFVNDIDITGKTVRLYQDGLPVCGKEIEIVKDLANAGSRNHLLLLTLMEKGAKLMGTESGEILLEEYRLFNNSLIKKDSDGTAPTDDNQNTLSASLLKKRDEFVADRINGTLCNGEMGILFMGVLHSLDKCLDEDIRVIYPTINQSTQI